MKPCSPYEEIKPEGQKGQSVEPEEKAGGLWKMWIMPGTDNSWRQAHEAPPCFDEARKIEFLRYLDKVALRDSLVKGATIQLATRENFAEFWSDVNLGSLLRKASDLVGEDLLEKISAGIMKIGLLELTSEITLICIYYINLEDELNCIDSSALSLYTNGIDEMELESALELLAGKVLADRLLGTAEMGIQANQQILIENTLSGSTFIALGLKRSFVESMLLEAGLELVGKKPVDSELLAGDSIFAVYGYNQGGYNIGGYG